MYKINVACVKSMLFFVVKICLEFLSSGCWVIHLIRLWSCSHNLSIVTVWVLGQFDFGYDWSFVKILILSHIELSPILRFVTIWVLSQFECCHKFSCVAKLLFSPFEFCHKLIFLMIWVSPQFDFFFFLFFFNLSKVTVWVFSQLEFCPNWCLCFVTI